MSVLDLAKKFTVVAGLGAATAGCTMTTQERMLVGAVAGAAIGAAIDGGDDNYRHRQGGYYRGYDRGWDRGHNHGSYHGGPNYWNPRSYECRVETYRGNQYVICP